jgi:DNA helicase II / ATP-dependent DNA helicase PcrA
MFVPRKSQERILSFRNGRMGITAVPGSGKTYTLSMLAATLISNGCIEGDQEILIVTLANSAVKNFSIRIEKFISQLGLLPGLNYRVRTLHGLAHDIVRERPSLAGLSDQFQIADEYDTRQILESACQSWMRSNPDVLRTYSKDYADPFKDPRSIKSWQGLIYDASLAFIRQAKDFQVSPAAILQEVNRRQDPSPLLKMGLDIYSTYQESLNYRGSVDFDDLIRFALQALQSDAGLLLRLQQRWPYILEDEAQDSSLLQEKILRTLVGKNGSWVRVGDPNQAIYESFTTANPKYLRDFCMETGVIAETLEESSRSTLSIIQLANNLVTWACTRHPVPELRNSLIYQKISPASPEDPNPNPVDNPGGIILVSNPHTSNDELANIIRSLSKWLPDHPDETVAVLSLSNERGAKLVELLKEKNLDYIELLQSSQPTRKTADLLRQILSILAEPASFIKLADTYRSIRQYTDNSDIDINLLQTTERVIKSFKKTEEFLYLPDTPGLYASRIEDDQVISELNWFRELIVRWQQAILLPIDQIILTISLDIFQDPADLALGHKLAVYLENIARSNPHFMLPQFIDELNSIAKNHRKFSGFSEEDMDFNPDLHKGKVVVSTYHKAKGLEWDRVYLTSLNNYDFPSAMEYDGYFSEKWFVRDQLNLPAECIAELRSLLSNDEKSGQPEGLASLQARLDLAGERLRLFYVGITRAKKELIITWNTGKSGARKALPLEVLIDEMEQFNHEYSG